MSKNTFVYENELEQLQNEFKNLSNNTNPNETNPDKPNSNTNCGLSVLKNESNNLENLLNKLKEYALEKKPTLAILTPCYGGLCYSNYTTCLINTIKIFESCNFPVTINFLNNDSLVPRARNNLIGSTMLSQEITHFIFIDGDIMWNPIDVIKLILSDKLIIGGVYPKKKYAFDKIVSNPSVISNWIEKKNKINKNTSDETIIKNNLVNYNLNYLSSNLEINNNITEVKHLATGFMMLKREAIEQMIQNFSETKYIDDTGFLSKENSIYTYALFDCGVVNGNYYSEDWLFCNRWSSIGGKIYVDISIDLVHIGTEYYEGSFIKNILTNM